MTERRLRVRVGVCLIDSDRVLLVEHEKAGRRYWLVPGGGVEAGETLHQTAAREVLEETGYVADPGPLQIVCEAIEPAGRHILNLIFSGRITGGSLRVGDDPALRDAAWQPRAALAGLTMVPPIGEALIACWSDGFAGPVRELGNLWR